MPRSAQPHRRPRARRLSVSATLTATHEAAHAVAALALRRGLYSVSIKPDRDADGSCTLLNLKKGARRDSGEADVMVSLAGLVAEQIAVGKLGMPMGASDDLAKAIRRARWIDGDLVGLWLRTEDFVAKHWPEIETLAGLLIDEERLSAAEVRRVNA